MIIASHYKKDGFCVIDKEPKGDARAENPLERYVLLF